MNSIQPVSRTALVTGSGRNIGRSIAVAIGEQGHNVVINGSEDRVACEAVAAEVEQAGGRAVVAMGDVGRRESFDHLIEVAHDAFGSVDILVNNAAIRPEKPFLDTTDADWHRGPQRGLLWLSSCIAWDGQQQLGSNNQSDRNECDSRLFW